MPCVAPKMRIIVVGGGILGSSIAMHLAQHPLIKLTPHQIVLLEAGSGPGNLVTARSWAWLNAQKKHPQHYRDLNLHSLEEWKQHHSNLVQNCGALVFQDPSPSAEDDPAYPCRFTSAAEIQQLEPAVSSSVAAAGAHLYAQEAWVDPKAAAEHFMDCAVQNGAQVHYNEAASSLDIEHDSEIDRTPADAISECTNTRAPHRRRVTGVRTASGRHFPAEVVILAAGTACAGLAAQAFVHIPLADKPAVVAITKQPLPSQTLPSSSLSQPTLLRHMLSTPEVFILQRPDGSYLLGDPAGTAQHEMTDLQAAGSRFLSLASVVVPALIDAEVSSVEMVHLPWPADGHPIVGCSELCADLYMCVTHSGMTLAPLLGRLVAEEVLSGVQQPQLSHYRPDREFVDKGAYGWLQKR